MNAALTAWILRGAAIASLALALSSAGPVLADDSEVNVNIPDTSPVKLDLSTAELQAKWKARIQSFLNRGVVPLVGMESTLPYTDAKPFPQAALTAMDRLGVALVAFDAYAAANTKKYRWSYYLEPVVNAHPDRVIPVANTGHNKSWLLQKPKKPAGYAQTLKEHMQAGDYPMMGEFEFRHYLSIAQCHAGKTKRDVDIPIDGPDGRFLFKLSSATGKAFLMHLEPEDDKVAALDRMLTEFPDAHPIWAHFGQLRHPESQKGFTADRVRALIAAHPNLMFDLATGAPNADYNCGAEHVHGDTIIWAKGPGGQRSTLDPAFAKLLADDSQHFVAAMDYGHGRPPLASWMGEKVKNLRLILHGLPEEAQKNIGYRNAWRVLTGSDWSGG